MTSSELKAAVVKEVACRSGMVALVALVEDYGYAALDACRELRRERKVRLVASACLADTAEDYGVTVDELKAGSIEGEMEWFVAVEAA